MEKYSKIGLVMALHVKSNVSLSFPHLVEERTLGMGIVLDEWLLCCQCVC